MGVVIALVVFVIVFKNHRKIMKFLPVFVYSFFYRACGSHASSHTSETLRSEKLGCFAFYFFRFLEVALCGIDTCAQALVLGHCKGE